MKVDIINVNTAEVKSVTLPIEGDKLVEIYEEMNVPAFNWESIDEQKKYIDIKILPAPSDEWFDFVQFIANRTQYDTLLDINIAAYLFNTVPSSSYSKELIMGAAKFSSDVYSTQDLSCLIYHEDDINYCDYSDVGYTPEERLAKTLYGDQCDESIYCYIDWDGLGTSEVEGGYYCAYDDYYFYTDDVTYDVDFDYGMDEIIDCIREEYNESPLPYDSEKYLTEDTTIKEIEKKEVVQIKQDLATSIMEFLAL